MKTIRQITQFIILCFFLFSCQNSSEKTIKYVFLFIGDGMGINQVNSTEAYLAALNNKKEYELLNMRQFPLQSFVSTYSHNSLITCSAASGTALSTGTKTSNGTLGLSYNWQDTLTTIAEIAKSLGMKVGIVSSVSIDHATPAAFYAHQPKRNMYYEISLDLANSNFDFFGGGGFKNPGDGDTSSIAFAKKNGYKIINTKNDFEKISKNTGKTIVFNPSLDESKAMPYIINKVENSISLAEYTKKAIEVLENNNGFFLMVEGGKIDWACHANDAATTIREVVDFDESIIQAINFYNSHPDETIIIVTADHETGGMLITEKNIQLEKLQYQKISYNKFEQLIRNLHDVSKNNMSVFNDILPIIRDYFGLGNKEIGLELTAEEINMLKDAYLKSTNKSNEAKIMYSDYNIFVTKVIEIFNKKAGITWGTHHHTSTSVPIFIIGDHNKYFNGSIDNTDIPKNILKYLKN